MRETNDWSSAWSIFNLLISAGSLCNESNISRGILLQWHWLICIYVNYFHNLIAKSVRRMRWQSTTSSSLRLIYRKGSWCFCTQRTGREICCSVTTGNNLWADDAGLRGMHSLFCTSEVHRTRPCNVLQRGRTHPDTWRVSLTLAINKSEDYVLDNNVSMFFSPSAPAYTHAHAQDEKSKICEAATRR